MFWEWFLPAALIIILLIALAIRHFQDDFLKREEKRRIEEETRRIENYFKRWPEVWRLYEYARDCGYGFEVQPADRALNDMTLRNYVWAAVYLANRNKIKFKDKPEHFKIIVPLDVLRIAELLQYEVFVFAGKILQKLLIEISPDNVEFLEKLRFQCKELASVIEEARENFFGKNLFSLSHEIGHLKIAEDSGEDEFYSDCRVYRSMGSQPACLLSELRATLRGLEVIGEIGLREVLKDKFVVEGKTNSFRQCGSCREEIEEERCPVKEKVGEVLKKFPE